MMAEELEASSELNLLCAIEVAGFQSLMAAARSVASSLGGDLCIELSTSSNLPSAAPREW